MASDNALDKIYAESMRNHPFGYALYQPTSTETAFPGACGFIDRRGTWRMLFNLNDEATVKQLGLLLPKDQLNFAPSNCTIRWGPKHAEHVDERSVDGNAGVE
jgi:hypothetical protein